jgi:hypothetical protein
MEAQRYASDFDGIAAGAPAFNFQIQNTFYHAWNARSNTGPDGKPIIVAADLPILHRAALKACHAEDGVIADPRRCAFDPVSALCTIGQDRLPDCRTGRGRTQDLRGTADGGRRLADGRRAAARLGIVVGRGVRAEARLGGYLRPRDSGRDDQPYRLRPEPAEKLQA